MASISSSVIRRQDFPTQDGTLKFGRYSEFARAITSSSSIRLSTFEIGSSDIEFLPAARIARKFSGDLALGVEYYSALGPFGRFSTFNEQQHDIYAVVDFKVGRFDVNAGLGYGLTGGSDRLMAKLILGMDLTDGKTEKSNERTLLRRLPVR